ncbi:MAG TPA: TlpA disulfide reductase family protein [Chitinophagales bacterium]|nr:AhpC/TSA family protein [Chitinophagales bacterium]HMW94557.1 TlpA disulfide reductase family protein [Chitinophagales bacterium]HMY42324.1 TlpA disulfide reductase family protein [Chitinophagales bacterium]HNB38803.1 TlpA disulfide reductase family protein [Chitinophagales bacterium]HND44916.1 TlpA disulfide reductase family protein [Chitinophagales bacterium]
MKKNSYLLLVLMMLFFASCSNSKKIKIEGTISNSENVLVVLEDINAQEITMIDTNRIHDKAFRIENYIKEDGLYRLSLTEDKIIYLYLKKGDDIKLDIDANNFMNYKVSGNEGSQSIANLMKYVSDFSTEAESLVSAYEAAQGSAKDSIETILNNNDTKYIQHLKDFIAKEENPTVATFAVNFFGPSIQEEMPYIIETVDKLASKDSKSVYIKQFQAALQSYKDALVQEEEGGLGIGSKAPNIALPNSNGDTLSLSQLQGKYVLLDFWASWCRPCRDENPNVVKIYHQYKDKGFDIFSVSLDNNEKPWIAAINTDKLVWKNHVSDLKGWNSSAARLYNVESIPTTYLIDPSGKIIGKNLRGKALENKLAEVFATTAQK